MLLWEESTIWDNRARISVICSKLKLHFYHTCISRYLQIWSHQISFNVSGCEGIVESAAGNVPGVEYVRAPFISRQKSIATVRKRADVQNSDIIAALAEMGIENPSFHTNFDRLRSSSYFQTRRPRFHQIKRIRIQKEIQTQKSWKSHRYWSFRRRFTT